MLMQIASMHIKNVLYGRSNETNEESECSQNGKYIDKVPRDLRHILNFPSQFYLALLPKYKSSKQCTLLFLPHR